ncbi:30S ribosomal protein S19e [Candidatus Woesearchaeota archaeon]|nr:30S ribosomal protein S19e [Candidatus Woesearchaeota archaeon]
MELIEKVAEELKKMPEMQPPEWATFVKTGRHKERPPFERDWWFTRAAAILRKVAKLGPIGVSKLRTEYGGRKNRGHKPDKTYKGSGNIIRKILQKLELIEFIRQTDVNGRKGRVLTPKGQSFIDKLTIQIQKGKKKEKTKPHEAKEEKAPETPKHEKPEVKVEEKKEQAPEVEGEAKEPETEPESEKNE